MVFGHSNPSFLGLPPSLGSPRVGKDETGREGLKDGAPSIHFELRNFGHSKSRRTD